MHARNAPIDERPPQPVLAEASRGLTGDVGQRAVISYCELRRSIRSGHTKERMVENMHVALHPSMHVALHIDANLGLVEVTPRLHPLEGLPNVETAIDVGKHVHVVKRIVTIPNPKRLPRADHNQARGILTSRLIQ